MGKRRTTAEDREAVIGMYDEEEILVRLALDATDAERDLAEARAEVERLRSVLRRIRPIAEGDVPGFHEKLRRDIREALTTQPDSDAGEGA